MTSRVALVTGGNRGIGRAIVAALLEDGWSVAYTYRTRTAEAPEDGERCRGFVLDLCDRAAPGALVQQIEGAMGPVEGLVNNAATRQEGLLALTSDTAWDDTLEVNLSAAFRCCRAVLPLMMHRRRGSIVNVASLSALRGVAGQSAYAASKAALLGLSRALAREIGRRNIRVNAVLPGFVKTGMTNTVPEEVVRALRSMECLPRGTSAQNVADVVAFLMSEKAAAITGQAVSVDAGASA